MKHLIKTYGRGLTSLIILIVAIWVLGMILVPTWRMIERSFIYEDRGGAVAMLALEIDRAYTRKFQIEQELRPLAVNPAAPASSTPGTPSAPSISSPSLPSVSLPQPSMSGPTTNSDEDARGGQRDSAAQEAGLRTELQVLTARIDALEAREDRQSGEAGMQTRYSLENFTTMSRVHFQIFLMTLVYAFSVTLVCFAICYPIAYAAATTKSHNKLTIIMLGLVIPYAINELLRIFSWIMILEKNGILNAFFDALGLIDLEAGEGMRFVASNAAVFTVMIYAYVLFMVFPIYNTVETLDSNQIEAARDLGASVWRIHTRIVIPHAKPGIAVGSIMTFMLSAGSIAAPEIVGRGQHPDWFSQLIYRRFFEADSWNQGSAYSMALLLACVVFIFLNMKIFKVGIRDIAK